MWGRFWGAIEETLRLAFAWGVVIGLFVGVPWFFAAHVLWELLVQPLTTWAAGHGHPVSHGIVMLLAATSPVLLVPSAIGWHFLYEDTGGAPLPPPGDPGRAKAWRLKALRCATLPFAHALIWGLVLALLVFLLDRVVVAPVGFFARVFGFPLSERAHAGLLVAVTVCTLAAIAWGLVRVERRSRRERKERAEARARAAAHAPRPASPRPEPARPPPIPRRPPPTRLPRLRLPAGEWTVLGDASAETRARIQALYTRKRTEPKPPEEPPSIGPRLTEAQWLGLPDAAALLRHAIPRIPVQHTCLVLSELAELAWPAWQRAAPGDWRFAWCLTALRAWCVGEASLKELDQARSALLRAIARRGPRSPSSAADASVRAVACASLYAGFRVGDEVSPDPALELLQHLASVRAARDPRLGAARMTAEVAASADGPLSHAYGALARAEAQRLERQCAREVSAGVAEALRAWIPYPWRPSADWFLGGAQVKAGDAVIHLDGWRIARAEPWLPRGHEAWREWN